MPPSRILDADVHVGLSDTVVSEPVVDRPIWRAPGWIVANRRAARLTVEDVGVFSIADGTSVVVDPLAGADLREVQEWIYGPIASILLGQQGVFALHATSVDVGGAVMAVAGTSGAGKSTTGVLLMLRGGALVADDLSPLAVRPSPCGDPTVVVEPTGRPMHLWPETAVATGLQVPQPPDRVTGSEKLTLPAPDAVAGVLRGVAVLQADESAATVHSCRVPATDAVALLSAHVHGAPAVREIWPEEVFSWAVAVAQAVPVHRVTRPVVGWTAPGTADEVERIATAAAMPVA